MHTLYVASVFLHILAAIVWVGGAVFLGAVLVPALRHPEHRDVAPSLVMATGLRFRVVGWVSVAVLVLTGTANLWFRGFGWSDLVSGRLFAGPFGHVLAVKLTVVTLIVALTLYHDLRVGAPATRAWTERPDDPEVQRGRRAARHLGRATAALSLLAVLLGVLLVRGVPG